jgi:predicted negative regulator of RcsB-dependent stress response
LDKWQGVTKVKWLDLISVKQKKVREPESWKAGKLESRKARVLRRKRVSLDSTEEEQIDQIKQFFKENGLFMLIAIVLVVGGNIGYDYYETSERTAAEAASLDFSNFQKTVDEVVATGNGREDALAMGEAIKADHPGTAYAALGALQLARLYFDDKAYAKAETELSFAADSNSSLIAPLARIRLAKVISAQSEFERALQALGDDTGLSGYASAWHETRGDILFEMGRKDEARQSYQFAVSTGGDNVLQSLTMKLEDLTFAAAPAGSEETLPSVETEVTAESSNEGDAE